MSGPSTAHLLKRAVPLAFAVGAGMELFMIKVPVGGQTFYDVAKRKEGERIMERLAEEERLKIEREERKERLRQKYKLEEL